MSDSPVANAAATSPQGIALWPKEVLARHLVSEDATIRKYALAMALQTHAPISECIEPLIQAAKLNEADPSAMVMLASTVGCVNPARATEALRECAAGLAARKHPVPLRTAATQALARLGCMPVSAAPEVALMLLLDDEAARQIALYALSPFVRRFAAQIAAAVASVTPDKWSPEALAALAKSAKDDAAAKRTVEAYVMRSLASQPLVPTGIAGYVALAELNSGGAGLAALASIVKQGSDLAHLNAALVALGQLGQTARSVARDVAQRLAATDDAEQEEALCRVLVQIQAVADDIPLPRVVNRIGTAPEANVVPHCMLLTLHPKEFAKAAVIVKERFANAGEPLKGVLVQTYKTLTQIDLNGGAAATGS